MTDNFKVEQLSWADVESIRSILSHEQQGICPICKKKLNNPCLDHQHTKKVKGSGQIRGVICRSCNVLLGKIENNCARYSVSQQELPKVLHNMAKYLEKEHLPYLHPSEAPKPKKLKKSSYNKLKALSTKCPTYPRSGKLTKALERLYAEYEIEPEFYAN
jgi:hypothetical protein